MNAQAEQMNVVVQRLAALVSGASQPTSLEASNQKSASLGTSDQLYHQISNTPGSKNSRVETATAPGGFDDFN